MGLVKVVSPKRTTARFHRQLEDTSDFVRDLPRHKTNIIGALDDQIARLGEGVNDVNVFKGVLPKRNRMPLLHTAVVEASQVRCPPPGHCALGLKIATCLSFSELHRILAAYAITGAPTIFPPRRNTAAELFSCSKNLRSLTEHHVSRSGCLFKGKTQYMEMQEEPLRRDGRLVLTHCRMLVQRGTRYRHFFRGKPFYVDDTVRYFEQHNEAYIDCRHCLADEQLLPVREDIIIA